MGAQRITNCTFHIHIPPMCLQGIYPKERKAHIHKKTCLRPFRASVMWHSVSTAHLVESLGNYCCTPLGLSGKTFPYSDKPWELWTNKQVTPWMDSKDNGVLWKYEKVGRRWDPIEGYRSVHPWHLPAFFFFLLSAHHEEPLHHGVLCHKTTGLGDYGLKS